MIKKSYKSWGYKENFREFCYFKLYLIYQKILLLIEVKSNSPLVYPGFRWWGCTRSNVGGGTFLHWRNKKFSVFSNHWRSHSTIEKAHFLRVMAATARPHGCNRNWCKILLNINWKWIILMEFSKNSIKIILQGWIPGWYCSKIVLKILV